METLLTLTVVRTMYKVQKESIIPPHTHTNSTSPPSHTSPMWAVGAAHVQGTSSIIVIVPTHTTHDAQAYPPTHHDTTHYVWAVGTLTVCGSRPVVVVRPF